MKKITLLSACLLLCVFALAGCAGVSAINGKILSMNQTVLGIDMAQDPASQSPHLRFGLIRNTYQIIPTTTNGTISTADFKTGIRAQHKLFSTDVIEQLGSGNAITNTTFLENTNVYNTGTSAIK